MSKREKSVCEPECCHQNKKEKERKINSRKKERNINEKQKRKNEGKKKYLDVRYDTFSIVSVIERTIHEKNKRKSF